MCIYKKIKEKHPWLKLFFQFDLDIDHHRRQTKLHYDKWPKSGRAKNTCLCIEEFHPFTLICYSYSLMNDSNFKQSLRGLFSGFQMLPRYKCTVFALHYSSNMCCKRYTDCCQDDIFLQAKPEVSHFNKR